MNHSDNAGELQMSERRESLVQSIKTVLRSARDWGGRVRPANSTQTLSVDQEASLEQETSGHQMPSMQQDLNKKREEDEMEQDFNSLQEEEMDEDKTEEENDVDILLKTCHNILSL